MRGGRRPPQLVIPPSARCAVISRAHQRRELVGDLDETFLDETRSHEGAIKSYELALHSSSALHGAGRHVFTDELVAPGKLSPPNWRT